MRYPKYSSNQFINATIMNQGQALINSGIKDFAIGLNTPGILAPDSLEISFNGNMVVTVNMVYPFGILFSDGTIANAHGITDGTDATSIDINFAALVPGSGSVTAYCLASLSTVNQDPYVVVGPPIGHPDYNPSFQAFSDYSQIQDTLSLEASLASADDETTFEIFRVTLSAGQTVISSVDTTSQVSASPIIGGDLDVSQINGFFNRSWHDVKASRALSTWYQNTNSFPIDVAIIVRPANPGSTTTAQSSLINISTYIPNPSPTILIDEYTILHAGDAIPKTLYAVIPPGLYYQLTNSQPVGTKFSIYGWNELY